ncbi:hypothetical protein BD830_11237 [Maritimibacter alkaliphilus HTCC2654]|uniref:Lipoprotein, putative n=1 Tax=Maritimibacter alkaliphilus HTCC2654 TaxID=314271 RepID=A3VFI9_9RHOB|nr:hypothetical protein [Maritimibacter alkaliphilus]EAQ13104.1 lipoprotein, putative [Rhodobacterales bacterium HTCC2654] [Maritimibacter alkaliphilus HTCC2654]TYP78826.1 hypothetical protein BD830_11237 [Maritimibacter alkaliphilus HTCC2654]
MRILFLLTALALIGCNSPSPRFMDSPHVEVEVAGSRFSVWRDGDRVEVIRTSPEVLPRLSVVLARAEVAIQRATGCQVWSGSLKGDQAVVTARLACG